jgi:hypothetical protein
LGSIPAAMLNAEQLQNELLAFQKSMADGHHSQTWGDQLPCCTT